MASLNKCLLIGSLGKDPEQRFMPNGNAVCNFSIATNETWKDKDGNKQEKVTWHNIVMFGKLAEIAAQYLKKGSQVYLEGRIENEKYQDKQTGQDRYTTKIVCDEMKMLGGKQEGQRQESAPARQAPQQQRPANSFDDDFSSDILF